MTPLSRAALLRQADEAVYARRNAAVAQERLIKESELNTEIAVEEKKRQIREAKMAADIAVEQQRDALVDQRVTNDRKDAYAKAYGLNAVLEPVKGLDWRTLMALSADKADPRMTIAMAFRDLAENASKIGELNISPDLLGTLLEKEAEKKSSPTPSNSTPAPPPAYGPPRRARSWSSDRGRQCASRLVRSLLAMRARSAPCYNRRG